MDERRPHRVGVGVVGVVDDEPAARKRDLLSSPGGEPDAGDSGGRALERETERRIGMERGERVDGVVALGERELELDVVPVDPEAPWPFSSSASAGSKRRSSMSARSRYGSSSALPAGTTAVPPAGSAAITSAFASATFSTVPSSSRCSGPMCGTTATSGRAIALSAAICPSPRMPISVTRTSVSGSSRHTVSGSPISLLRLFSAQIVGVVRSAERSQDVLRGGLARRADDGDDLRARSSSGRGKRARPARPPGRPGRASQRLAPEHHPRARLRC